MTPTFDIGIRCGYLMPMSGALKDVVRDYFVGIKKSKIECVIPYPKKKPKCKTFIDASKQAVLPGFVNGHCHQAMVLFRGLADDLPFHDWLFKHILPAEEKNVSSEMVKVGVELALMESISFGVTTICDMYFFMLDAARVYEKVGLRAVLAQAITDNVAPDAKTPEESLKSTFDLIKKYGDHPRITPAFGPHAPYTCGDNLLKAIVQAAQETNAPICIHVSETKKEVEDSLSQYNKTPPQRLNDLGLFNSRSILFHCVHLTDQDVELLSEYKNLGIVHNPESNMKLSVGVAPILKLLKTDLPIGLGTDGAASNNNLNIQGEAAMAAKVHKVSSFDTTAVSAREALRMATLEGARALGLSEVIGSVEPGKYADLAIWDLDAPHMQPLYDLPSQIVYSATGTEVSTVICHGKVLMKNRKFTTLSPKKIMANVSRWQTRIKS